jgi:hypothetical protein
MRFSVNDTSHKISNLTKIFGIVHIAEFEQNTRPRSLHQYHRPHLNKRSPGIIQRRRFKTIIVNTRRE